MIPFLQQIHMVDYAILEEYVSAWDDFSVKKRTVITAEGQTQRHLYFVLDGVQKSYYLNEGKEHVIAFTYPPSFTGIPESFFSQTPAKYFLEAITDSRFKRISYEKHQEFLLKYRPIETLFRKATEILLTGFVERHFELLAYDIESRFRSFTTRSPHLLNLVPHKDLASYLRIDPTNFSKLLSSIRI